MRTGLLALVVSALWLAGCSPANGMEVRVFGSGAGETGEGGGDPGPEGYGGEPGPEGQGGEFAQGGEGGSGGDEPWTPDASGGNGGTGGDPGTGGTAGTGGDPGEGGSATGGSSTGGSGPAGSGGSAGSTGGSGGGGTICNYPTGGFGTSPGSVVSPSVSWDGFPPGASSSTSIQAQSFYDCDGTQGINALLIVYGAGWCTACQEEAALLPDLMQTWGPAGIVVVELLVENSGGSPATTQTAKQWRDTFNLSSSYVAADPSFQLQSSTADSFPYKVLVDPRTMTIVSTDIGGTSDDAVMQLALKNK